MSPNVAASIKARLLDQARKAEKEFQLYLVRYASERFLYRLGASSVREQCVLKGAGLLALWMPDPYRSTRDLDFTSSLANEAASVRELLCTVCAVECPEDGLRFDAESLEITPIRTEEEYAGHRARLTAHLGKARIPFQLDFGFGGAVLPPPEEREFPTLLPGVPVPRIRAYRREASIAEKFEAMVRLGLRNSRMKDFHDIWALSSAFEFEGEVLRESVAGCFERRQSPTTAAPPDVLRPAFYHGHGPPDLWAGYLRGGTFLQPPPEDFEAIGGHLRTFLGPLWESVRDRTPFDTYWPAGGPWQAGRKAGEGGVRVV